MSKRVAAMVTLSSLALSLSLVACAPKGAQEASSGASSPNNDDFPGNDEPYVFDANVMYVGRWIGSARPANAQPSDDYVELMVLSFAEDGTASVAPSAEGVSADAGTWEGSETEVRLHLGERDVTLAARDAATLTGRPEDFDLTGFDTIEFRYFG